MRKLNLLFLSLLDFKELLTGPKEDITKSELRIIDAEPTIVGNISNSGGFKKGFVVKPKYNIVE
ncbi:MAG: hypothetical protein KAU03_01920 [Candidatus Altiarchaeales archaeon]|nr:hypothetical protein [Candidatus Altiarchaeales archaeon]